MAVKKLHFLNPNAVPPKPPDLWSIYADVWSKVWTLVASFAGITIVCAALYFIGSRHGWGIKPTFIDARISQETAAVSFFDCMHFSVVTIATLGYGDYRPESYGRIISGFEVLGGIVLMGVFIARLVSRQQDRIAKRLLRGQLNTEIQDFRDQLASLLQAFREQPPAVVIETSSPLLYRARGLAMSIGRYWRHEAAEADLVDCIPLRAAGRLLGEMIDLLEAITNCVVDKSKATLHHDDFKAVRSITESTLTVATVLLDRISDEGLRHSQQRINELVLNLRQKLQLKRKDGPSSQA